METGTWNLEKEVCNKKLGNRTGLKLKGEMKFANWNWDCETKVGMKHAALNVEFVTGCAQELKIGNGNRKLEIWVFALISNPNLPISFQHLQTFAPNRRTCVSGKSSCGSCGNCGDCVFTKVARNLF